MNILAPKNSFIAPIPENFPLELRSLPRWVVWKAEGTPGKKPSKIPYTAREFSGKAKSTAPSTWVTYVEAVRFYQANQDAYTGIGFVLSGDGLAGIDIDHCVVDGIPQPAAIELLERLNANYVEISPSGTGLRAFGYAENLPSGCNGIHKDLKVEVYTTERYLTLTGKTIKAKPLENFIGFRELADSLKTRGKKESKAVDKHPKAAKKVAMLDVQSVSPAELVHKQLIQRILSGDVYHDSLRDLAASFVATGMQPGAVVNLLRSFMDCSAATHDERWEARRDSIPDLVNSASLKFLPLGFTEQIEAARAANEPRYKLLGGDELLALPPLAWRVRGVLPALGLAALYGPSASGKSFLAFDMAAAIAEGGEWFGCRVEAASVVYAALEGEAGFKLRAQAWESKQKRPLPQGLRMLLQPFRLTEPKDVVDLAAVVPEGAVVVVDTLNRAAPTSDENSSRDMGEILEAAKRLQEACNGLVLLVHHTGKNTAAGLRGHSSLFAAMDAAIEVSRDGDRREWKVAKSKDGIDGVCKQFGLHIETLGVEVTGEEITSCVIEYNNAAQSVRAAKLPQGGNQRIVLEALRPMFALNLFEQGLGHGIELDVAVAAGATKLTCASDRRATRAREAITGLVARGVLSCENGRLFLE